MGYRCITNIAVPITSVRTHDEKGNPLPKPINTTKCVKKGEVVNWVDYCSRKHFVPTDEATKRQDREDFKKIKTELKELNITVPGDATFAECADSLAAIKATKSNSASAAKKRFFTPSEEEPELTNKEIRALLDEKGVKHKPTDNKTTLLALLNG